MYVVICMTIIIPHILYIDALSLYLPHYTIVTISSLTMYTVLSAIRLCIYRYPHIHHTHTHTHNHKYKLTSNTCTISHTHTTHIVILLHGNDTSTACSMTVPLTISLTRKCTIVTSYGIYINLSNLRVREAMPIIYVIIYIYL